MEIAFQIAKRNGGRGSCTGRAAGLLPLAITTSDPRDWASISLVRWRVPSRTGNCIAKSW